MYVVPGDSLLDPLAEHWDWLRLSIGQRPETSPDAWAALRDAEDKFWRDVDGSFGPGGRKWVGRPFVRNYERWLTQVDVPGGRCQSLNRGRASRRSGTRQRSRHSVLINVTYWDGAEGGFRIRHAEGRTPEVRFTGAKKWRTASLTVRLPVGQELPGKTDFWIEKTGTGDASYSFVGVVRLASP